MAVVFGPTQSVFQPGVMRAPVNKLKTALISGLGIVGGVVTLKALQKKTVEQVDDAEAINEAEATGDAETTDETEAIDDADAEGSEDGVTVPDAETATEAVAEDGEDDVETTIDEVVVEAEETASHVTAAVEHGRATVEKAVASFKQKA